MGSGSGSRGTGVGSGSVASDVVLRRDPVLRTMNDSFAVFVKAQLPPAEIKSLEAEGARWHKLRGVMVAALVPLLLFLTFTQRDAVEVWIAYLGTAAAGSAGFAGRRGAASQRAAAHDLPAVRQAPYRCLGRCPVQRDRQLPAELAPGLQLLRHGVAHFQHPLVGLAVIIVTRHRTVSSRIATGSATPTGNYYGMPRGVRRVPRRPPGSLLGSLMVQCTQTTAN